MPKKIIIYSKKLYLELVKQGFYPITAIPHPTINGFNAWVFEDTEEFQICLNDLIDQLQLEKNWGD